jgi:multimeric flavodoxin WrbA
MKTLAILGSANSNGNTACILRRLIKDTNCDLVDLNKIQLSHFRYDQKYDDEFMSLVNKILASYLVLIATPVYWYTYSSIMKIFIDRFSDLLISQKDLGRQLRGKRFGLVFTGSDAEPDQTLISAFSRFCEYLGLDNFGCLYSQYNGEFTSASEEARFRSLIK